MIMRPRLAPFAALLALAGLALGVAACGSSDNPNGTVAGTITIGTDQVVTVGNGTAGSGAAPAGTDTGAATGTDTAAAPAGTDTAAATGTDTAAAPATGDAAAGKTVFTANCGGCHTMADAGTSGAVGPNLDDLKPDAATVQKQVENGGGAMPAFKGTLSDADIANVAAYVASAAGK
jgi:mono/diheme cytochrome c family protein